MKQKYEKTLQAIQQENPKFKYFVIHEPFATREDAEAKGKKLRSFKVKKIVQARENGKFAKGFALICAK